MGVWGTRLYAGDFAMDLRSTIAAVARLPFETDRLLDILCETEPAAAKDPDNEDHTTFWLIAADLFAKRGIVSDRVRNKALDIIDANRDLTMLERLGMPPADLAKRAKVLKEVRARIIANTGRRPRLSDVRRRKHQSVLRIEATATTLLAERSRRMDTKRLGGHSHHRLRSRLRVSVLVSAANDDGTTKRKAAADVAAR
jgi:hypothetical protein